MSIPTQQGVSAPKTSAELFGSAAPVLVDFWADWCVPCKALQPAIDEVANTAPWLDVVKINVGEQMDLANELGIKSVPTLLYIKGGIVRGQLRPGTASDMLAEIKSLS